MSGEGEAAANQTDQMYGGSSAMSRGQRSPTGAYIHESTPSTPANHENTSAPMPNHVAGSNDISSAYYTPDIENAYEPDYLGKGWGDHSAADNQAHLARAQYEDYKRRFVPVENELIDRMGNRDLFKQNSLGAMDNVQQAYDTSTGEYMRGLGRYGVTPTDQQQQSQQRQAGLSMAADMAEAANRARADTRARNMLTLAGGLAPADNKPSKRT